MNHKDLSLFVYEAVEKPQRRSILLATFAEIIGAAATAVVVEDRQLRWASFRVSHGMDQETMDSYPVTLNPYSLRRPPAPGEVRRGHELISEAEFLDSQFYHDWYKPRGWRHPFSITLDTTATEQIYLFGVRPPNHPFTEKDMSLINGTAPHLAQAMRLAKGQWALQQELDRFRSGAAQLDSLKRFKLSPTQARIAQAIAHGQTPKEIAHRFGITLGTLRSHEKRIHKKCGVNRQSDLVRLVLNPNTR